MKKGQLGIRRRGVGYVASGPGFYTWQRERSEAVSWAGELRCAAFAVAAGRQQASARRTSSRCWSRRQPPAAKEIRFDM